MTIQTTIYLKKWIHHHDDTHISHLSALALARSMPHLYLFQHFDIDVGWTCHKGDLGCTPVLFTLDTIPLFIVLVFNAFIIYLSGFSICLLLSSTHLLCFIADFYRLLPHTTIDTNYLQDFRRPGNEQSNAVNMNIIELSHSDSPPT